VPSVESFSLREQISERQENEKAGVRHEKNYGPQTCSTTETKKRKKSKAKTRSHFVPREIKTESFFLTVLVLVSLTLDEIAVEPLDVVVLRVQEEDLVADDRHRQQERCSQRGGQAERAHPQPVQTEARANSFFDEYDRKKCVQPCAI
jgi:hypothetical protein